MAGRPTTAASRAATCWMGCTPAWSGSSAANAEGCARAERAAFTSADLLYFHRFDPTTPVEESLAAVEDLVRQDLVRYFAVSNFTVDQLALYAAAETHLSLRCRVLAVQNQWDMVQGESAACRGVLEYAARCGLVFVAYSPLARGLLTERYLEPGRAGSGDRLVDEGALANLATPQTMATAEGCARAERAAFTSAGARPGGPGAWLGATALPAGPRVHARAAGRRPGHPIGLERRATGGECGRGAGDAVGGAEGAGARGGGGGAGGMRSWACH